MAGTPAEQKACQEAHRLWNIASDAQGRVRAALHAGPWDYEAEMLAIAELRRLHEDFMEKSKPFSHTRGR